MKTTKLRILALFLTLVMCFGMLPMSVLADESVAVTEVSTDSQSAVQIKKSVISNDNGTYKITMEAYVTGIIKPSEAEPLDIVLVLDQSGSMADYFDKKNTRQKAMKNAVKRFIDAVGDNSAEHAMALVTFGSDASTLHSWTFTNSTGVKTLKSEINSLPDTPSGATKVSDGMTKAKDLLSSRSNNDRQKIVIVFTDGVPTTHSVFSTSVANDALKTAQDMKNDDVLIYTIGIFSGANPEQLYGGLSSNIDSSWTGDPPAGNRFLNYLSSNYTADEIGLSKNNRGEFTITKTTAQGGNYGYYLTAADAVGLEKVFSEIAENITPSVTADETTVLSDTLTAYFLFNEEDLDVTGVSVKEATASGTGEVPAWTEAESSLVPEFNVSTVSVTDFDYSANPVVCGSEGWSGKKLIVSFDIKPNPEVKWKSGRNVCDTNKTEDNKAGLYDKDKKEIAVLETSPQVEVMAYIVSYAYGGTKPEGAPDLPTSAVYLPGAEVTVENKPEELQGYTFDGWKDLSDAPVTPDTNNKFTMPERDVTLTGSWEYGAASYTVEHYFEQLNGKYVENLELVETINSTTGAEVKAEPKTVEGYVFSEGNNRNKNEGIVAANNSLVLKLYYDLGEYKYTIHHVDVEDTEKKLIHDTEGTAHFGSVVVVSDKRAEINGYGYETADADIKISTATDNNEANIYYKKGNYSYTVKHVEKENSEKVLETETKSGSFGTSINVENLQKEFTGYAYASCSPESFTIGTANNEVIIYYVLNSYDVTYQFADEIPVGAKLPESEKHYYGQVVEVAEVSEVDGYSFSVWESKDVTITDGKFSMPDMNVTLTGRWEKLPPNTISIPISKIVEKNGNANPGKQIFEFELFDFGASSITEEGLSITGNTITTDGAGTYNETLEISVEANMFGNLTEGFYLREKKGTAENWTYSDEVYHIFYSTLNTYAAVDSTTDEQKPAWLIYPTEKEEKENEIFYKDNTNPVSVASFTNIYTKYVPIDEDDDDDIYIPFVPKGNARLIKVDAADADATLSGARFNLYKSLDFGRSQLVGTFTTDEDGEILVKRLIAGDYYWQETRAPEGYTLDDTKYSFRVVYDKTATVTAENEKTEVPPVFADDHYAYIIGYEDGLVRPQGKITRAEVATIFFRLLSDEVREENFTKENDFTDVKPTDWFNNAVSTMAKMGVIKGYPDGSFGPSENITRAEFAAIATRFETYGNTSEASFNDIYTHWATREISIAANNGWVLGYEDGSFRPDQSITRAEAMTMVNRVLRRIPETVSDLYPGMVEWADNMDTDMWYYLMVQEATNSHFYEIKDNGYENWTKLRSVRDWTELEK